MSRGRLLLALLLPTSAAILLAAAVLLAAAPSEWRVQFVDVAKSAGLMETTIYGGLERKRFIIETNGSGVAWIDYDRDGWIDALVLSGTQLEEGTRRERSWPPGKAPTNRLYRNNHDGTFRDVTDEAGLRLSGWASAVCAGDYDNDGWLDLFITYYGQNVLYHNRQGRFFEVTAAAGLATHGVRWGSGCSFVDYDRDGKLDLFVANYLTLDLLKAPEPGQAASCLWKGIPVNCGPKGLATDTNLLYHNEGNGRFRDVSEASGIAQVKNRYPMTASAADLDSDGWVDIYVACDSTAAIFYHNNHDGTFSDVAMASGTALSEYGSEQAGMGLGVGDFDGDGRLDLFKTHFADDIPALYRNLGRGQYEEVAMASGLGVQNRFVQWGAGAADLDNDGRQDLLYATGNVYPEIEASLPDYPHRSPKIVFRNLGDGRFEDVSARSGPGATARHSSRGLSFGDYDNDGDLDALVMNMNEPPSLLRNGYEGGNGWLAVRLLGVRSNRAGIGATVVVTSGGRRQARAVLSQSSYYSHDDLRLHFGLGPSSVAESVEVRWPSGAVDLLRDVPARSLRTVREGEAPAASGAAAEPSAGGR